MKISIGFRFGVVICFATLFIGAFGFFFPVQADKAGNLANAAEKAVAHAEDLYAECETAKAENESAHQELDEANRRVAEAAGTSEAEARQKEQKKALKKAYDASTAANKKCGDARQALEDADALIKAAEKALKDKTDRGGKDDDDVGGALDKLKKRSDALKPKKQESIVPPSAEQTTESKRANGLRTITFDTPPGRVTVNLPDDMMAGDTISGTVVAEPKGNSSQDKEENRKVLEGMIIDLQGTEVMVNRRKFTWILPTPRNAQERPAYQLKIVENARDTSKPKSYVYVDVFPANLHFPKMSADAKGNLIDDPNIKSPSFAIPQIGQAGRPIEIIGHFDGNAENTKVMYGPARSSIQDFEKNTENVSGGFGLIQPLAESPRKVVCESPPQVIGPVEVLVKEGNATTTSPYRSVGVSLSAPKTNLLKGEHTELHVEVNGLQGINKPVPLRLESQGVITMEGGMYQPLVIQPSQVGADGRYTMARGITGVQAGGWSATVTVVTQSFNIVLRDPDPPQTVLINSFTGDYVFCGSNVKLKGTGEIKLNGNAFTLTDNKPDRQVQGVFRFDSPKQLYFPVESLRSPGTTVNIQSTVTESKPPRTKVYFNPLGRPAPPVQDVSAFATCP